MCNISSNGKEYIATCIVNSIASTERNVHQSQNKEEKERKRKKRKKDEFKAELILLPVSPGQEQDQL
jgi:hypothetical protein